MREERYPYLLIERREEAQDFEADFHPSPQIPIASPRMEGGC
jgi:hypothetical protein